MGKVIRTVHVTQRHIDLARRQMNGGAWCPVARAIKQAMRGTGYRDEDVRVLPNPRDDDDYLVFFEDYGYETLPVQAIEFAHDFDLGMDVEPFTFTTWTPA